MQYLIEGFKLEQKGQQNSYLKRYIYGVITFICSPMGILALDNLAEGEETIVL